MAKGYVIAHIAVNDMAQFGRFAEVAGPVIKQYGGKMLVKTPQSEVREGECGTLCVMLEFDSKAAATTFYESAEYQAAIPLRNACSTTTLTIVEGLE